MMYVQEITNVLAGQFVKIKYDCNGGFERCGKEWSLKLKDAIKNAKCNEDKHICRKCQLRAKNPMKKQEVKDKVKKTTIERYGTSTVMNTSDNITTRNEKMFGTQEAIDARTEKTKKTNLERYGVEHAAQSEKKKEKALETFREKYGTDHPMQNEDVKEKARKTTQERYGVDSVLSLPEVRIKGAQTTLERYGVEHYNQLPEMKDYLKNNCTTWLAESYATGGPNKGVARPEEWNQKQRETVTMLMMAGAWRAGYPRSKKGFCYPVKCDKQKVYFRSSYEAIYCYYLEHHKDVESFSFEAFRIPYEWEGKTRFYVPDFLVRWTNKKLSIKELKAEFLREDEQQIAKQIAGTLFAGCNDMDYELLFNDYINSLDIKFETLKQIGFVKTEV